MQNLKVYLTSRNMKNKAVIEHLKLNVLKNKPPALTGDEEKVHHQTSHNQLSKSYQSKQNPSTNSKKRTISNSHNRSLQQIYDFRAEVKKIIKEPHRYEKQENQKNIDKFNFNIKTSQNKRNSKQISETRLYYRSQPHPGFQKIQSKNAKSQKNLESIIEKRKNENIGLSKIAEEKPTLKIKPNLKLQTVNKNTESQKLPVKKRSKSANAQNKKLEQHKKQRPKQKRSTSLKKVNKNHKSNSNESSLKGTVNLLSNQIELKSMFRTRKGVQIMNPNKVNQDRLYLKQNVLMANNQNMCIYAVADGHGPLGHFVSHLIVDNLHKKLDNYLRQNKSIQHSLERSFHDIQSLLGKNIDFNADFSGSTLVTLVIENNKKITCANVGDSRAIVARQLSKTSWEVIRLSNDHKPSLEEERKRILSHGGRIDTVYDEEGKNIGPLRVWLPKKQLQGLAMSRSLGDNISKPIGVTHEPQILEHQLTKQDKFILIASDGVWQFLTNYQILSLIIPYYKQNRLQDACEALMKQAYRSWTKQDNSVIDDITFILIFLKGGQVQNGQSLVAQKRQQDPEVNKNVQKQAKGEEQKLENSNQNQTHRMNDNKDKHEQKVN